MTSEYPIPVTLIVVFLSGGAWYIGANRRWVQLLVAEDPRLRYDDTRDPIGWAIGSPYRLATWVRRLRAPDGRADVELWRVRMLRRFLVWIILSLAAFIIGDLPARLLISDVDTMLRRFGTEFGLLFAIVGIGVGAYYAWWAVRALWDFGNGYSLRPVALALGLLGAVVALAVLTIVPGLDFRK